MPFQIKTNFIEKWAFNRIKNKYPAIIDYAKKLGTSDVAYNWIDFENLLKQNKINFSPSTLLILVKPIFQIVAKNILDYDENRILKVEKDGDKHGGNIEYNRKFKFNRNKYSFKINKADFLEFLNYLQNDLGKTNLYIKFGVDKVEDKENASENFNLYFGGINDYNDINSTKFVESENIKKNDSFQLLEKSDISLRNKNFKEKHYLLFNSTYYPEFKECKNAGGLIHNISETRDWINKYISKNNFYLIIGCDYKFKYIINGFEYTNEPYFNSPNCENNNLTTAIFTDSPNRNIGPSGIIEYLLDIFQVRSYAYGDKGGGCCP